MKIKKSDAPYSYIIEQGMYSPRDGTIGWRYWSEWTNLDEALNELKGYRVGIFRIVETKELYTTVKHHVGVREL